MIGLRHDNTDGSRQSRFVHRRCAMRMRKYRCGPLAGFAALSLLGFVFFTGCLGLVWLYADDIDEFVVDRFKKGLKDFWIFIILATVNAFAFLITFIQLALSKPTSRKVLIPIVLVTICAFAILIAIDFFLEVQLSHMTPKQVLTKTEKETPPKKTKGRFKMGYFVIYASLCIVAGFLYLSYKDFEEYLSSREERVETTPKIVVSHIT